MKNIMLMLIVVSFALPLEVAKAQVVPAGHISFVGVELRAKEVQHAVFAVQVEGNQKNEVETDDWHSLGSGFFVSRQDGIMLGVTCRHIVQAADKLKKPLYIGFDDQNKGYIRLPCYIDYIDQKYDVAILGPQRGNYKHIVAASKTISRGMIGDESDLVPGRGVLIPGYPLGLGVEADQNHPVFRIGIIAQYTGRDSFLIDGVASHGNSGSPIFSLLPPKVIGMITAHKADRISLFDENGQPVAALPYNAGLAQGISAEVIGNILDELNRKLQSENPGD